MSFFSSRQYDILLSEILLFKKFHSGSYFTLYSGGMVKPSRLEKTQSEFYLQRTSRVESTGLKRVWNVILGAWQTSSDPMYLEKNIKFHQKCVTWEKNIKIFEHSSPHPFLQAPLHICVICPNPSLGCLPPKSDRRQFSRLCSVLLCIIFLQHMCYVPTPV